MNEILTSETLKAVRKHKNMTQAEFAKKLGYSETYIQKLEQGRLPITYEFTRNFKHSLMQHPKDSLQNLMKNLANLMKQKHKKKGKKNLQTFSLCWAGC